MTSEGGSQESGRPQATIIEIETERLLLRQWEEADLEPFYRINSDRKVMEFFPSCLTARQSDELAQRCQSELKANGWGLWALEEKESGSFVGFTGLHTPGQPLPFSPCIEISWRLAPSSWGKGLATEAARAALATAFHRLHLDEVVSFTATGNYRSVAVMERLGMVRAEETFEHPALPPGHRLREHLLYRVSSAQWASFTFTESPCSRDSSAVRL